MASSKVKIIIGGKEIIPKKKEYTVTDKIRIELNKFRNAWYNVKELAADIERADKQLAKAIGKSYEDYLKLLREQFKEERALASLANRIIKECAKLNELSIKVISQSKRGLKRALVKKYLNEFSKLFEQIKTAELWKACFSITLRRELAYETFFEQNWRIDNEIKKAIRRKVNALELQLEKLTAVLSAIDELKNLFEEFKFVEQA